MIEMNGIWIFAYVVPPIVVAGIGYAAVRLNDRAGHRHTNHTP